MESENRLALLGILVTDGTAVERVNELLHEFAGHVCGRMGLPIRERRLNAITLVIDAPVNIINALTGKLGAVCGVTAKAMFAK